MLKKGKYYVGDLCYVNDERWDEVCNRLFASKSRRPGGEFELEDGIKFAVYCTAWGDGCYEDNLGNQYGVDAGVIGCIRVDDLHKMGEAPSDLGTIHEFEKDFETGYEDGTIFFGDLKVETDRKFEEEEVPEFCYCTAQGGANCQCEEED